MRADSRGAVTGAVSGNRQCEEDSAGVLLDALPKIEGRPSYRTWLSLLVSPGIAESGARHLGSMTENG
jgi:hypothetical protein